LHAKIYEEDLNTSNGKARIKSYQNNNQNSYSPQAGPSNSDYKPAPYKKKFVPNKPTFALNPRYQYPDGPQKVGPNWQRNQQNHNNKRHIKQMMHEKIVSLEKNQQPKADKGKSKEKAAKTANLLARINDILLLEWMEDIDSYQNRVNLALESKIETKKVEQTPMDVDN
jgi:hypothetical protein